MSEQRDEIVGESEEGFSAAAEDAVKKAEERGIIKLEDDAKITLVVTRLEVDVEGPIGEYRVVLGPGG